MANSDKKETNEVPGVPAANGAVTATAGVVGAAAGAAAGAIAGPVGAIVGSVIGAVAGAAAGGRLEVEDEDRERYEELLDEEIGVIGGDLGARVASERRPPRVGAISPASAGSAGVSVGPPSAGGRGE